MSAQLFRNSERAFSSWLLLNPNGYVVNTTTRPSDNYFVLHRAHCTTLHRELQPGAYTERAYMKACTSDATPRDLEAWIRQVGGPGFTKLCAICNPATAPKEAIPAQFPTGDFDTQVASARQLSRLERAAHLPTEASPPAFYRTTTICFARSPFVVAEVLDRAAGHCEQCKKPAPFVRARDDTPYLEVHHKVRLADGGYDTVENAVALCPNCHRQSHHGHTDG